MYLILAGGVNIPNVVWFGREGDFNAMVIDLQGIILQDLFMIKFGEKKLTRKTASTFADQILARNKQIAVNQQKKEFKQNNKSKNWKHDKLKKRKTKQQNPK